jgi:AraC family transcriptional regulator
MSRDDMPAQNPAAPITTFHGQTIDRLAFDGLNVSEVSYRPGQRMRPHAHADAIFSMVLHGFSLEHVGRDSFNVAPSLYRYHPPEEMHENVVGPTGWRLFNIEVPAYWLTRSSDEGQLRQRGLALTGGPMTFLIQRMLREFRFRDCNSRLVMEGLALELVGEATRAAASYNPVGSKNRWLTHVVDRINGEFARQLTLGELASAAAVDPTHLARCFRRRFNCTIGEYVRRVRIAFACRKLQSTDVPLKELAAEAGFCNQSHFGRAFKAMVGVTPVEYRRLFRDG